VAAAAAAAAAAAPPAWRWEESDDAVLAYSVFLGILALGSIPALHDVRSLIPVDLPYFIGLAVMTIYIGAHRGLTTTQRQQLTFKEGLLAPVFASAALFGCYLLIKYLPDFSIQVRVHVCCTVCAV
jgi:minor histocompatibility antigen H13